MKHEGGHQINGREPVAHTLYLARDEAMTRRQGERDEAATAAHHDTPTARERLGRCTTARTMHDGSDDAQRLGQRTDKVEGGKGDQAVS